MPGSDFLGFADLAAFKKTLSIRKGKNYLLGNPHWPLISLFHVGTGIVFNRFGEEASEELADEGGLRVPYWYPT